MEETIIKHSDTEIKITQKIDTVVSLDSLNDMLESVNKEISNVDTDITHLKNIKTELQEKKDGIQNTLDKALKLKIISNSEVASELPQ